MKGQERIKLYAFCKEVVGDEGAEEFYNFMEAWALSYLDEKEENDEQDVAA